MVDDEVVEEEVDVDVVPPTPAPETVVDTPNSPLPVVVPGSVMLMCTPKPVGILGSGMVAEDPNVVDCCPVVLEVVEVPPCPSGVSLEITCTFPLASVVVITVAPVGVVEVVVVVPVAVPLLTVAPKGSGGVPDCTGAEPDTFTPVVAGAPAWPVACEFW